MPITSDQSLQDWRTVYVCVAPEEQDRWVCAAMASVLNGAADSAFFVRAETEKLGPHLRIRAASDGAKLLDGAVALARSEKRVVREGAFVPEWSRYLGCQGLTLALRWFALSTREALGWLQQAPEPALGRRLATALLAAVCWTDSVERALGSDGPTLYPGLWSCWLARMTAHLASTRHIDAAHTQQVVAARCEALYARQAPALRPRVDALRGEAVSPQLSRQLAEPTAAMLCGMADQIPAADISFYWASILHMHFIRMGITNMDEFYLYFALSKMGSASSADGSWQALRP